MASPNTLIAVQFALLPPVEAELPELPPLPAWLVLVLSADPPLPPLPPSPEVTVESFWLDPVEVESPPVVLDPASELPPVAEASLRPLPASWPPEWLLPSYQPVPRLPYHWLPPSVRVSTVDVAEASPPRPDEVLEPVRLSPEVVVVSLSVVLLLPPVSPPRAPLPPDVVEEFSTSPPFPPFPVEPELPDVAWAALSLLPPPPWP